MRRALVVQHAAVEGVGRFAEWFPKYGVELQVAHPYVGDPLPAAVAHDALIVMGGPMGVYDDADAPWLPATKALLADAVQRGVPTLGVCLGAQLLAVATGGKVERGAAGPELGLGAVEVSSPGVLLDAGEIPVVQWHYDTVVQLPAGATLLASSTAYPVQAFQVGEVAWGLQFHVEATPDLVGEWARAEGRDLDELAGPVAAADEGIALVGEHITRRFAALLTD